MGEETTTGTSRFASYRERILRGSADVFDRVQKEGLRAVLPGGQHGTTSPTAGMAPMPKAAGATAR